MHKVVFDTNITKNHDGKSFLGGRPELEKFTKNTQIIFPDIVIEEIKNQKRKNLKSKRDSFLNNPFHWITGLNRETTKNIDLDHYIEELQNNEIIQYSIIQLTDFSVLSQIKELATKNKPPFEDESDKGFKDTYIYFTILEYLQTIPDKNIFVCTKDGKLSEALNSHSEIIVIKDYEDFLKHTIAKYQSQYYLDKLKVEIEQNIIKENIIEFWININDNEVVRIELPDATYMVEFDSGEIISSTNLTNYLQNIDSFINSGSFSSTHTYIGLLTPYIQFFTDSEIIKIMQGVKDNEQIHWILSDDDVKQFVTTLYDRKKDILPNELEKTIKELLE